jgi:hypothetical protein
MNRIITCMVLILIVVTSPAFASLSWTCPNCGETFYFDPRDEDYMNNWIPIHLNACRGGSSSSSSDNSSYSKPYVRPSFGGALLLGSMAGGILGGLYGLVYAEPDMWAYAIGGALVGAAFTGVLWTVSEPPTYQEAYVEPTTQQNYEYQPVQEQVDTSVVDLSDKTSDIVDINVVRGVNISDITVKSPVENPAQFKYNVLTDYSRVFNERIQGENDTAQGIIKSLKIKEPPSPIKNISELAPGDVVLIAPNGLMSKMLNKIDNWASDNSGSPASHTASYLGEKDGKRWYLNNTPEDGPVIMEEKDFLAKYYGRDMNIATLVGQPLSKHEGDELFKGANEFVKSGGYGIKALPAINGNDNMVCSEASRWLLLRAGRRVPETQYPIKKPFVKFSPSDFYEDQQYFIVHSLGMNK